MKNDFIITRVLNAPPEMVWKAISDKDEMKQWYFDLPEFKAEPGFEFHFKGGPPDREYGHTCTILEAIPNKKLSYSWLYDGYEGYSVVSFLLEEAEDRKTKLTLTHEGLSSFPANNPDLAAHRFAEGWNQIVSIYLHYYVQGLNAAALANRQITITRTLDAPIALVWQVFTTPEHIAKWWGPDGFTNTISKMEMKAGGEWEFVMHGPDGTDYKNKNIFKEVTFQQKIVYEHVSAPKHITIISFAPAGEKTVLTWHGLFESNEQLQQVIKTFKADEGLKQNIEKLVRYLQAV